MQKRQIIQKLACDVTYTFPKMGLSIREKKNFT